MTLLIKNIGLLLVDRHGKERLQGAEMARQDVLHDAWLLIEDGRFAAFGEGAAPGPDGETIGHTVVDAAGGAVLPSFCDSHTHLVYAGSREH